MPRRCLSSTQIASRVGLKIDHVNRARVRTPRGARAFTIWRSRSAKASSRRSLDRAAIGSARGHPILQAGLRRSDQTRPRKWARWC